MANKTVERAYLDLARELYAGFAPGDPRDSESPDFVWPDGSLSVEVRGLFQECDNSKFSVRQTEGFVTSTSARIGSLLVGEFSRRSAHRRDRRVPPAQASAHR